MPAAPTASPEHIRDVNTRYHDAAATEYDSKWGIDYGDIGQRHVREKIRKALGTWPSNPFGAALEIGAGTGYFSLNLLQQGAITEATCTDISQGMLDTLGASAEGLGLGVRTVRADAERLPFEDESFDLVFGHAVLHHIPDLDRAFSEFARVLRPGGTVAFCGEPSRYGDWLAAAPKRVGVALAPLWRRAVGVEPRAELDPSAGTGHELEGEVDVHAFGPGELAAVMRAAGFGEVRIRGEELVSNMYGWLLRTLESSAEGDRIPWGWRMFAFRSYMALQRIDSRLLEPNLPPGLFYNLVCSARKPG